MLKANVSFDIMSVVLPLIAIALIYPSGLDLETGALISKGSTRLQEIVDMCPSPSTLKNFETRCGHTDLLLIRDMVGANAVHVWADATKQNGTEYNVSVLCWFDNKRQSLPTCVRRLRTHLRQDWQDSVQLAAARRSSQCNTGGNHSGLN